MRYIGILIIGLFLGGTAMAAEDFNSTRSNVSLARDPGGNCTAPTVWNVEQRKCVTPEAGVVNYNASKSNTTLKSKSDKSKQR